MARFSPRLLVIWRIGLLKSGHSVGISRFLRLPQVQQHIVEQHLITRLLVAQASDEGEHIKLVGRVLAFDVESMGVVVGAVCPA